jgi:hypothetical protein
MAIDWFQREVSSETVHNMPGKPTKRGIKAWNVVDNS